MSGRWRVGRKVDVHLYRDDAPAGTCLTDEQAAEVAAMSDAIAGVRALCDEAVETGDIDYDLVRAVRAALARVPATADDELGGRYGDKRCGDLGPLQPEYIGHGHWECTLLLHHATYQDHHPKHEDEHSGASW